MAGESKGTRVIALVGPAGAGKTSLAEAMLFAAGTTDRLGSTANGSSIGDSSPEARQRGGSTELNLYHFDYLGDPFAIIDCPGLDRLRGRWRPGAGHRRRRDRRRRPRPGARAARRARAEDARRARHSAPHLRQPHRPGAWPHPRSAVRAAADQRVAADRAPDPDLGWREGHRLRRSGAGACLQIPPRQAVRTGRNSRPSSRTREIEARTHMLEQLADHDDELLEQLLMDQTPDAATRSSRTWPARPAKSRRVGAVRLGQQLMGRAAAVEGAAPRSAGPAGRRRPPGVTRPLDVRVQGLHGGIGRLAMARVLGGRLPRDPTLKADDGSHARRRRRCSRSRAKRRPRSAKRRDGDVVAVAKIDAVKSGAMARRGQAAAAGRRRPIPARNCALAIEPADRKDDVKLSGALQRLSEEDAALVIEHDDANHEIRLRGVNDEHLNTVMARLKRRYGVEVRATRRRSAIANRSANRSPSRAATRSSPAGMASSAT